MNLQIRRGQQSEKIAPEAHQRLRKAQNNGAHQAKTRVKKFFLSMGDLRRAMAPSFLSFSFSSICNPQQTQRHSSCSVQRRLLLSYLVFTCRTSTTHLLQETFWNGAVVDGRHFGNQPFSLPRLSSAQQPPGRLQNTPGNDPSTVS